MPNTLCRDLSCIDFPGKSLYTTSELYTDSSEASRALYTAGALTLRIDAQRVPDTDSDVMLTSAVDRMKSLFEKAPAPYPGDISDAVVCDPAYVPHVESVSSGNLELTVFTGYLNGRMTFGSCSESQSVYRGKSIFFYCRNSSTLIRMDIMTKTADYPQSENTMDQMIGGIACTR